MSLHNNAVAAAAGQGAVGGSQPAIVRTSSNDLSTMENARAYYANNAPVLIVSDDERNRCAHGCTNQVGLSQILANAHNACNIGLETHFVALNNQKATEEALKDIKAHITTHLNSGGGLNATILSRIDGQLIGLGGRLDEHAESLRSTFEKVCATEAQIARLVQLVADIAAFSRAIVEGQRIDIALMAANVESVKNINEAVQRLENLTAQTDALMNGKIDRIADRIAVLELVQVRANGRAVSERGRTLYSQGPPTPAPVSPVAVGGSVNGRMVNGNNGGDVNMTHLPPYSVFDAARTTTPN